MAIDLLAIQPHKVSRDLSGYITFIYGAYKTGKTTLATQMDGSLLLAFEQGYNALPGVYAQPVLSWGEMKQIYRELKKPEVKEVYKAVVVDGVDVAADLCKKYICNQNDIEELGDLGYGKGWAKFKDEFNTVFRGLTQLGYAVFFIGHNKEGKDDNGNITNIRPLLSNSTREIIAGMADIYAYAKQDNKAENSVLVLRDPTGFIDCGCRFKYVPEIIPCNYKNLAETIFTAIDREAAEHNNRFVTNEKMVAIEEKTYNYDELISEFQGLVEKLMIENQSNAPKITAIVEKYLGKGKKVGDTTPDQAEFIYLINIEIKEDLM
jgi:hypothetical protein